MWSRKKAVLEELPAHPVTSVVSQDSKAHKGDAEVGWEAASH